VAVDSQGTLLAVRVTGANRADSAEAGAVMTQGLEAYPSIATFTADAGYRRQAEQAAHALGPTCTSSKKAGAKRFRHRAPALGRPRAPLAGSVNAAAWPRTTKSSPRVPKRCSG
jgi:hypothetical protein